MGFERIVSASTTIDRQFISFVSSIVDGRNAGRLYNPDNTGQGRFILQNPFVRPAFLGSQRKRDERKWQMSEGKEARGARGARGKTEKYARVGQQIQTAVCKTISPACSINIVFDCAMGIDLGARRSEAGLRAN